MPRFLVSFLASFLLIMILSMTTATTLFEFTDESTQRWGSVDDSVMGGISDSQISYVGDGIAKFSGVLSLENNGGFASVRNVDYVYNLSKFEGVELRVKNGATEGKTLKYQFRFQTNIARISYTQHFDATDEWTVVRLPFSDFEATFFGRMLPDAPVLNTEFLRTLTIMLSDKQDGDFELLVDSIKVY